MAILVALALAGCAKNETTTNVTEEPSGPRTIQISAADTMKYSVTSIDVKAGEEFTVVLMNTGVTPRQAMAHNLVVLKPGSDADAFSKAGAVSPATDYIPAAFADEIIARTKLLGPKESDTLTLKFNAPGVYPYLCTFPAHYQAGMKGTITVR